MSILALLCLANFVGLLVAGLGPFHAPQNLIERADGGGLKFGYYGTILSQGALIPARAGAERTPITFEFWMHCGLIDDHNTFLAFYDPRTGISVSFHQLGHALAMRRWRKGDTFDPKSRRQIYQPEIFRPDKAAFVTVASDGLSTDVFLDGQLVRSVSDAGFGRSDLEGRLVVFDAPRSTSSWGGLFRGFAMYEKRLTQDAVRRHHRSWTQSGRPELAPGDRAIGLFLFKEPGGSLLKNEVSGAGELRIPERYTVVDQAMLQRSIPGMHLTQDIVLNVAGFVPFGILVYSLTSARGWRRAALTTLLMGFTLSLAIESLQSLLPTRDSTWTDVATNTIGTVTGVLCYRYSRAIRWLVHDSWQTRGPKGCCTTQRLPEES